MVNKKIENKCVCGCGGELGKHDEDGLCIRHGQVMLLEPCYKCLTEEWNGLISERDDYENALKEIKRYRSYECDCADVAKKVLEKYGK